jgi:K+/H+ antiporter YhaU regulatory subunit KhtT
MAAGTESAVDTRTYNSPSLVGNIVEKVLIARQLAENERKFAEKKAAEAGTSLEEIGVEKGFFFKQALRGEFGGNFVDKKTKQLKGIVKKYKIAKRISKNPKVAFNFIKPILLNKTKRKTSGAQTKMFRAKFDYTNYDEVTTPTPKTPVVGATAKKIQKATTSKSKRISREELLSSITEIANSLNKTAESIGRTTSGVSASVISASNAQMQLVEQLKIRNTTLEDKLNEIAKAISDQTIFQKQSVSRSKVARAEERLENQTDVASVETPDDTATAENETLIAQLTTPTSPITNVQNISSIGGTSSQNIEHQQMNAYNNIPQAESGGIISGPDSGYLAKLHGDELIVPLKNNYTEGKKSAVDGKVRRRPSSNSSGGVTSSSLGGRFGFGIANMTGIGKGGSTQASALTQPLIDAMSLIPMAVGGGTLAQLTSLMASMGSEAPIIGPYIQQASRSLANVFGLPSAIVNKATGKTKAKEGDQPKDEEEGESKKNILQKMMEGFGKLLEKLREGINNPPPPPPPPPGQTIEGKVGEVISADAKATYYDPALGGINASGAKTAEGLPATSTGEGFVSSKFTAAAFPELIKTLPESMTTPSAGFRGGRTIARGQAFNVMVTDRTGKSAIVRVNDVGSGVAGHAANHMLDFSPAVADYFGNNRSGGLKITMAPANATPGPITAEQAQQITSQAPQPAPTPSPPSTPPPAPQSRPTEVSSISGGMGVGEQFIAQINESNGVGNDAIAVEYGAGFPKTPKWMKMLEDDYNRNRNKPLYPGTGSPPRPGRGMGDVWEGPGAFAPSSSSNSMEIARAISTPLDSNGPGNVAAIMLPQGEQAQVATTVTPSTHETASAEGSRNDIKMSQIYISSSTLS